MRRLRIALLLILALLLAPFAPVQASWSCPNGTACVADGGQGYHCANERCGAHTCCMSGHVRHCHHGAVPEVKKPGSGGACVEDADQCRYTQSERIAPASLQGAFRLRLDAAPDLASLPAVLKVPHGLVSHVAWLPDTCGCGPPPL